MPDNNIPVSYSPVISRIIAYRHEKVFQIIWDKLTSQEKDTFLDDLMSIEHDLMDSVVGFICSSTIILSGKDRIIVDWQTVIY
jgi:hypothetical protein